MPTRKPLPSSPLQGAAPVLRPTARPLEIQPGARPPARSSALLELGNAFQDFVPELRGMLRDAAAREDRDAMALGEIDAEKATAEGRMGEIEAVLKDKVEAGEMPHRSLPAYERGFRTRISERVADGYLIELQKQVQQAAKNGDAESVIRSVRQDFDKQIASGDFFGRVGFDHASRSIEANFRQQVAADYAKNYQEGAEYFAAEEGRSLMAQLAAADADNSEAALAAVKTHLDTRRGELPVHQVNRTFLNRSVAPVFDDLLAQDRYDEAAALADRMASLDLTGQGGLLSKTTEGQQFFAAVRQRIDQGRDTAGARALKRLEAEKGLAVAEADVFAAQTLETFKREGSAMLPSDIDAVVDLWARALPEDPAKAVKVRAARERLRAEVNEDAIALRKEFEPQVSAFMSGLLTLRKEDLDRAEAALPAMRDLMTAQQYQSAVETISARRSLSGVLTQQHQQFAFRNLYAQTKVGPVETTVPYFDNSIPGAEKAWEEIGQRGQSEHQIRIQQFITERFQHYLGEYTDANKASLEMPTIQAKVIADGQTHSAKLALQLATEQKAAAQEKKVAEHLKTAKTAAKVTRFAESVVDWNASLQSALKGEAPDVSFTRKSEGMVSRGKRGTVEINDRIELPEAKTGALRTQAHLPRAEWDSILMRFRDSRGYLSWLQSPHKIVDLPALAKQIEETDKPEASAKARELYGVAKGLLGYTPEEIKAGVTKHGVSIPEKAIDPQYVRVFRDKAELEANWNNGQPTPLFLDVGNRVLDPEPGREMTSEEFYRFQSALFAAR